MISRRQFLKYSSVSSLTLLSNPALPLKLLGQNVSGCELTSPDKYGLGPFYTPDSPFKTQLFADGEMGTRLFIAGKVFGPDCSTPIKNALVEVWHANDGGIYDNVEFNLRGSIITDDTGSYAYETIYPGQYNIGGNTFRPAHIHYKVTAVNHQELITQLYFEGDQYIEDDFGASDPKAKLRIIPVNKDENGALHGIFDIILTGASFLDFGHDEYGHTYQSTAYPNPVQTSTTIKFQVPFKGFATIRIYNIQGQVVFTLMEGALEPGRYSVTWGGVDSGEAPVSNGTYIYRFVLNNNLIEAKRLLLQR